MKRAITLLADGRYKSILLPLDAFTPVLVDQKLVITSPIDFGPYGAVVSGDIGTVIGVNQETGELEIHIERVIPAMRAWGNAFVVLPFENDDIIAALRHVSHVYKSTGVPYLYPSQGRQAWS